jgi:cell division transport system permease protein
VRPRFFLAEAVRSIRSNMALALAATVTVLIAIFVLGAFIPSFLYVQSAVDAQKQKIDVSVYISDSAEVNQVNALQGDISGLEEQGVVREFTYVSKDDALAAMRERLDDPSILEELPSNPFPASFEVKLTDPENADQVIAAVEQQPALDPEDGIGFAGDTADRLLSVARFIQWSGLALILILTVAAVLLIGNTIRLSIFARRREVEVMKLVGATNWFIRWPFVIEGIICGLVGALLSIALLLAVKIAVVDRWIDSASSQLTDEQTSSIGFVALSLILLAAGAALGALGSGLTLRRFLRV